MSKRDLLRKANAGNAQKRGTEAVLNEDPIASKSSIAKASPNKRKSIEETPAAPKTKIQVEEPSVESLITVESIPTPEPKADEKNEIEIPVVEAKLETIEIKDSESSKNVELIKTTDSTEPTETAINTEKPVSSISTPSSKSPRISKPAISENLAKYTGNKISKSIMLTAEDNKYLIKQAAAQKKPIQDIFGEVMADEIEEVKKGNVDEELAETFLKLKANNERRNVLIPEDLSIAIADTASEIPLKQGKFILYALSRKRQAQ
ncbi:hypothetical protein [Pseudobutyrivibrio xylanivorans]|uniref:Uncharacterized protein n=1 Tax=Pseudobutyrivibrio xylanivorans TaxID=185007 RepID=A0A1G5S795_PSEXY|nr:hypothetical protein [Pseudobutyrivibrio xylanivorans]SCZ81591.1 hypothetical protein SAMN02910350_02895 [Pseudobutyrivibrio xylanivorans]